MIVINMLGDFANEMYEYAYAYILAKKFHHAKIISIVKSIEAAFDPYRLEAFDNISHEKVIVHSLAAIPYAIDELFTDNKYLIINDDNCLTIEDEVISGYEYIFLNGQFQFSTLYKNSLKDLRKLFDYHSDFLDDFRKAIDGIESVGIHVRRQGFTFYKDELLHDNYYKASVAYIRERIGESCQFFVFSDDMDYASRIFGISADIHFIKEYGGTYVGNDEFFCLSACKHRILTRGSSYGRMADLLSCSPKEAITVYSGEDTNHDHFVYLNQDQVTYWESKYTLKNKEINKNDFAKFEIKEDAVSNIEKSAKQYFFSYSHKSLLCYRELESLQSLTNKNDIYNYINLLKKERFNTDASIIEYSLFNKSKCIFYFVPSYGRSNTYPDEVVNLALCINRMGFCSAILRHEIPDKVKCKDDGIKCFDQKWYEREKKAENLLIQTTDVFIDCNGFNHRIRHYDIELINKTTKFNEWLNQHRYGEKKVIIIKDVELLCKLKEKLENAILIFWDNYSDEELGNYGIYDARWNTHNKKLYSETDMEKGYAAADIVITCNPQMQDKYKKVVLYNLNHSYVKNNVRLGYMDLYSTEKKYLDIANGIINYISG